MNDNTSTKRLFTNNEEKRKWCEEWDYYRGFFNGVKPKNLTVVLSPKLENDNELEGEAEE